MPESDNLFDLFIAETKDHLELAEDSLLQLESTPEDSKAIESCFRAIHTIKGSAGFFELVRVQALAHASETVLDHLRSKRFKATSECLEVLLQTVTRLGQEVANLEKGVRGSPDEDAVLLLALGNQAKNVSDPSATSLSALPDDVAVMEDFIPEVNELMNQAEGLLINPILTSEGIEGVHRAFSTLTGICSYLGFAKISQHSRMAEEALSGPDSGRLPSLTQDQVLALLGIIDDIRKLVKSLDRDPKAKSTQPATVTEPDVPVDNAFDMLEMADAGFEATEPDATPSRIPTAFPGLANENAITRQGILRTGGEGYSRIAIAKLEDLVNLVGELMISQSMISDDALSVEHPRLRQVIERQSRIMRELQNLALSMRMVPLRSTFKKIARAAHDTAHKIGKDVVFTVQGEETEIDRTIADGIADPLLHMIRNAVDHGVDSPAARAKAGKSAKSQIRLSAVQTGDHVVISMEDDGPGLDPERLRVKAVEQGLLSPDMHPTSSEAFQLIFIPGFSTASQVTEISGRGVGMDVVRRNVQSLNGTIDISSELGRGVRFTIKLPLTTAIMEAMLLRVGSHRFLLPVGSVIEANQPTSDSIRTVLNRGRVIESRGQLLPIARLCDLFSLIGEYKAPGQGILLVVEHFNGRFALEVDEIIGQQQVVIKPLSKTIPHHPGLSGSAILSDGRVGLILDPNRLLPSSTAA